jgi:NAD(P)H-hydrate epimerase
VLKGYRTIVADPSGTAFINPSGNPGMATAGMGDGLTGIIAGLLAQQLEPLDAAVLGVFLHGLAADLAVDEGSETEATLTAGAVLEALSEAFERLGDAAAEGDEADDAAHQHGSP